MSAADELKRLIAAQNESLHDNAIPLLEHQNRRAHYKSYLLTHAADFVKLIEAAEAFDSELMQRDMEEEGLDAVPWAHVVGLQRALKPFTKEAK